MNEEAKGQMEGLLENQLGASMQMGEVQYKKKPHTLQLTPTNFQLEDQKGKVVLSYKFDDVLGAVQEASDWFNILTFEARQKGGKRFWRQVPLSCAASDIEQWINLIQNYSFNTTASNSFSEFDKPRYKVLVNPVSGAGYAVRRWNKVKQMFAACDIDYQETTHKNHAAEIAAEINVSQYTAIIVCSGDGLIHEVIQGLCNRQDADEARQIPIGMMPGGSGNAMAKTCSHASGEECSIESCAYWILKGRPTPLDITLVTREGKSPIYSFMSVAWALIADIDIDSEFLRCCCGGGRFDIYGLWLWMGYRSYQGHLSWSNDERSNEYEGRFIEVTAMSVPWLSTSCQHSPNVGLSDGKIHLVYKKYDIGRCQLASSLFKMDNGEHINLSRVHSEYVTKWALNPNGNGKYSIDGEVYEPVPCTFTVLPSHCRVMIKPN